MILARPELLASVLVVTTLSQRLKAPTPTHERVSSLDGLPLASSIITPGPYLSTPPPADSTTSNSNSSNIFRRGRGCYTSHHGVIYPCPCSPAVHTTTDFVTASGPTSTRKTSTFPPLVLACEYFMGITTHCWEANAGQAAVTPAVREVAAVGAIAVCAVMGGIA